MNLRLILFNCVLLILFFVSTKGTGPSASCSSCRHQSLTGILRRVYEWAKQWLIKLRKYITMAVKWLSEKLRMCLDKLLACKRQMYMIRQVDTKAPYTNVENLAGISFVTRGQDKARLVTFWQPPEDLGEDVEEKEDGDEEGDDIEPLFALDAENIRMDEYRGDKVKLTYQGETEYEIKFKSAHEAERFRNFLPYESKAHLM